MNKQKINAYLEESLQPWHKSSVVEKIPDVSLMCTYILLGCDVNEMIKNLIVSQNNDMKFKFFDTS